MILKVGVNIARDLVPTAECNTIFVFRNHFLVYLHSKSFKPKNYTVELILLGKTLLLRSEEDCKLL